MTTDTMHAQPAPAPADDIAAADDTARAEAEIREAAFRWTDTMDGLGDPRARTWPELSVVGSD